MKTVCLLPVANDARIWRRIAALERRGVVVEVLAFERERYAGADGAARFRSLGVIQHGRYARRLLALLGALTAVRAAAADADVVYAFGLDVHALAWLATRSIRRRPSLIYEVADLHPVLVGTGPVARLMRALERHLLADTRLLVVTSEAVVSGFYRGVQKITRLPHLLIENKPDLPSATVTAPARMRSSGPITIGYFGMIRCQRSWQALRRIAACANGQIRVYLRGVPLGLPHFEQEVAESPWIEYGGPFVSPRDLMDIYRRVDLSWIAHRMDDNNSFLWNRANRFYEACAFHTPMVAQVQSQDGHVVAGRDLGPCIDLMELDACATRMAAVTWDDISKWQRNMDCLPRSVYLENGEHDALVHRMLRLENAV